jgi:hypothetical protein
MKAIIFLLLSVLLISDGAMAESARSSSITHWGNCGGSTRTWWDDMCMAWRKKMGSKGWSQWWRNYNLVTINRYVDQTHFSWANDDANIDGGDAGLICTHGGHNAKGWYGVMHHKYQNQCQLNTNEMKIGPGGFGKMRFWHMSSCNSIRWQYKTKWFGPAADKVHVITGFHGWMYIGYKYVKEYRKLANYGFKSKGVGKVWMDKMHHVDHWYNAWKTVCPMSLGFGQTTAQAANAHNERYKWKWSDKNPYWMNYRWWGGCNPDGGPKLPN